MSTKVKLKPKLRGFICTTAHPVGCEQHVKNQINYAKANTKVANPPKRVLVIGASSGYGLSSRITAAFGCNAATLGIFFEKPASERRPGTAGWHNSVAFEKEAKKAGLYAKSINGDAFSHAAKQKVIETIKQDLQQVDLVVYSLASPVRKDPDSGEVYRSVLKPIGENYTATAVDTDKNKLFEATIEPATEAEIDNTVKVMGGEDWQLWIDALQESGCLADGCRTVAYSYIGTELTWPIYWNGSLGKAKQHLDATALKLNEKLSSTINGKANIAVLKSVVTQASAAIPVMPLYIALVYKKMREAGFHEGCIEQIVRLDNTMYSDNATLDDQNRYRMDDLELQDSIQEHCKATWSKLTDENLSEITDYQLYKDEFLRLFGFQFPEVDYEAEVTLDTSSDFIDL
jgi:enoyl-[acyl-carrier protein] reductase/trans-2-enoyl-CoA reductase (NAD+)